MSTLLAEVVAGLKLDPGQTYRTIVGGCEVQIHRPADRPTVPTPAPAPPPAPDEEPSQFADMVMLDPWFDLGDLPSLNAITVTATRGEPILPPPLVIDDSDLAPE